MRSLAAPLSKPRQPLIEPGKMVRNQAAKAAGRGIERQAGDRISTMALALR
jgi:hypothetical protein